MNEKRCNHASVSMGNKLFVIGGYNISSCEVFDSCSRKFTIIISEIKVSASEISLFEAFCIGSNIVIFQHAHSQKSGIYMFNVMESRWSTFVCSYTNEYFMPNCIKYYVQ